VRVVHAQPPDHTGVEAGLSYAAFEPSGEPLGGVVVLHGAGSRKESHYDFARAARGGGLAALVFDARGHGESGGEMGAGAIDDVAAMADVLRGFLPAGAPIGLRGSSMGGYFALVGAAAAGARAVVAICPAPAGLLRLGLAAGRFGFAADRPGLEALLEANDATEAAGALDARLLLLHAAGDEQVPVEHSREIARAAPHCRYVELPGGHHRSIQHDAELQGDAVRFLARAFRRRAD
jgi:pimeloyl-ACP methyl ester carboxylesterase